MSQSDDDDQVGYRRPPKKHQFKPGQSGNPKGRPKGTRNLSNILNEEMERKVTIHVDGQHTRMTKAQLAVRQQVDKAAKGDRNAFMAILQLSKEAGEPAAGSSGNDAGRIPPSTELSAKQYDDALAAIIATLKKECGT